MEDHNHFQDKNLCNLEMKRKDKIYLLNRIRKIKKIYELKSLINFVNNLCFI
jgi:hypothetical protein